MNFLFLHAAIRFNAISIAQAAAQKMYASFGKRFFYNSFVEYFSTNCFLPSLESSMKMLEWLQYFSQILKNFLR